MTGPVLFCYDGSDGSRAAMRAAGDLIGRPADGFVLSVWQPAYVRLAVAESFGSVPLTNEAEIDQQEAAFAQGAAEEGARLARERGFDLTALTEQARENVAHTILEVADRLDVALIVCGQRGRGAIRTALLGSVSHTLSAHARRPILIAPEGD